MEPEAVLELAARAAEQAEVFVIQSEETPVTFEANRLKLLQSRQTSGLALRVIKKGRLGFSSSTKAGEAQALVERALALAELGPPAPFDFPTPAAVPPVEIYDPQVESLSVEAMVALGQGMVDRLRQYHPDLLCHAGVAKAVVKVQILNSQGGSARYRKTIFSLGLHGNLVRGTDMLDIWEGESSCRVSLDPTSLVARILDKLALAEATAKVSSGSTPVLFTPKGVAGSFLGPLAMALSGKLVLQGASPLGGKIGQPIFHESLSLYDEGALDYAPASAPCDHEGVPTRRTPLIQNGIVQGFYYDLQTAGLAGLLSSTGNGFRSLDSPPAPATTSLIVNEGSTSWKEMLADIAEGLMVDQVTGAWAGNLLAGDFSASVHLGYKIEKGRVVGRVKDAMVAGNIFEALKGQLVAVGDRAAWVNGGVKTPPLYFRALSLSAQG